MKNPGWIYAAVVAGTCFWWVLALGSTPNFAGLGKRHNVAAPNYPTLQFTTNNETREYFYDFIESLRDHLWSGDEVHGIRLVKHNVSDDQRFVLVELTYGVGIPVTIAIDVVNAHLVAYRFALEAYFFENSTDVALNNLFTDAARCNLTFNDSYSSLEQVAEESRENISLGRSPLIYAIEELSLTKCQTDDDYSPVARALLVVMQMFSEAARFNHIVERIMDNVVGQGFTPDTHMIWLENNWENISTKVQEANYAGIFGAALTYQNISGQWKKIYGVTGALRLNMGLILFVCTPSYPASTSYLMIPHLEIIRGISTGSDDDACPSPPEPTVRIIGRDDLCITVPSYVDDTPLVLSDCTSTDTDVNQLWTFKTDETIRSNEMCMTASGSIPKVQVMIHDCQSADPDATNWNLFLNGTTKKPTSELVLQAISGEDGTELVVNNNAAARDQGWLATNNTKPLVTPIISFTGACLQEAEGSNVALENCTDDEAEQNWVLYADGSIRGLENQDYCLGHDSNYTVLLVACNPPDGINRWMFKTDGSISNLGNGLAMEVTDSETIVLTEPTGGLNQTWLVNL